MTSGSTILPSTTQPAIFYLLLATLVSVGTVARLFAQEPSADDHNQRAVAILRDRCSSCHGEKTQEAGLRLDEAEHAFRGGENGPVIVARSSESSELILRVTSIDDDRRMPPEGQPLTAEQVLALKRWIDAGARWPSPAESGHVWSDDRLRHWAWQPIQRVDVPTNLAMAAWARNEIDQFVLEKLSAHGLRPAVAADRATLIRRVTFDLIGLPPTEDEVAQFVSGDDPLDYEKLVDRLLASPRYGERWARHWLDVVHYADTHGYDKDQPRPNAWPYRDYVIRAFNEDKPYAQFVAEQIAGDVLYPGTRDGIEATGFIAAGPWDLIGHAEVPETKIDGQIARHLDRDDMVANALGTFCSVTVHCAQCHDHKFDPITQEDYYALQADFAALDRADRTFYLDANYQQQADALSAKLSELRAGLAAVEAKSAEKKAADESSTASEIERLKSEIGQLQAEYEAIPGRHTVFCGSVHQGSGAFTGTGATGGQPRPIYVLHRGSVLEKTKLAQPGALSMFPMLPARFELPSDHREYDRRAALAHWLTDANNPLTWRSIVNRVWQQHFGRGIVDTANDFGRMGSPPTHPELFDWLAADFRDHGGSLKRLHRQIVCSAAYQQRSTAIESEGTAKAMAIDADNRYLWRQNRRKLDAESIRDAVLQVSGKLDLTMGGPGYQDFVVEHPEHSPHYEYSLADPHDPKCFRRAVYRFIVRSQTQPLMTCLDCADPSIRVAKRNETTSPLQALALLNNAFILTQSEYFAARLRAETRVEHDAGKSESQQTDELAAQVNLAAKLTWGRLPNDEERRELIQFARENGLAALCRAVLNTNEFVFVD